MARERSRRATVVFRNLREIAAIGGAGLLSYAIPPTSMASTSQAGDSHKDHPGRPHSELCGARAQGTIVSLVHGGDAELVANIKSDFDVSGTLLYTVEFFDDAGAPVAHALEIGPLAIEPKKTIQVGIARPVQSDGYYMARLVTAAKAGPRSSTTISLSYWRVSNGRALPVQDDEWVKKARSSSDIAVAAPTFEAISGEEFVARLNAQMGPKASPSPRR